MCVEETAVGGRPERLRRGWGGQATRVVFEWLRLREMVFILGDLDSSFAVEKTKLIKIESRLLFTSTNFASTVVFGASGPPSSEPLLSHNSGRQSHQRVTSLVVRTLRCGFSGIPTTEETPVRFRGRPTFFTFSTHQNIHRLGWNCVFFLPFLFSLFLELFHGL